MHPSTPPHARQTRRGLGLLLVVGLLTSLAGMALPAIGWAQDARDYVYLVGPRTLYPYMAEVIDHFGEKTRFKYPRIETTNTEAGIKLLCAGAGFEYPDIATAVRPIEEDERARCRRNDAGEVIELKVGFDTVILGTKGNATAFPLTTRALFLAIAKEVPNPEVAEGGGAAALAVQSIPNPYERWQEVDPALPDQPIKLITPPRTDIAMDLLTSELLMRGCRKVEAFAALEEIEPQQFQTQCTSLREDGRVEESTDELKDKVAKLEDGALALLRLPAIRTYPDLAAVSLDGAAPSIKTVNGGSYPGSRPVFLFIKRDHLEITPGLRAFVQTVVEERTSGVRGYLTDIGLVPLSEEERNQVSARATTLARPALPQEDVEPGEAEASPQARLNDLENRLWESVRRSDNPDEVQTYLNLFPNGVYARSAQARIATLRRTDTDRDGVPDYQDECRQTPAGATVDAQGCPSDADGDGIFDGIDQCPQTVPDSRVDAVGCPIVEDTDDDGITDTLDRCPDTVAGAVVDANGCATDTDNDGVTDGVDQCAETPRGATVDATGCPTDEDDDGVFDGIDQCPDTPAGVNTDDRGCWVLRVTFAGGAASLAPETRAILEEAIAVLEQHPDLRVEVGGYTDSTGRRETNMRLSRERAQTVADYLVEQGIAADRLTVEGYGPDRPVASNDTEAGRGLNRRVELVPLR